MLQANMNLEVSFLMCFVGAMRATELRGLPTLKPLVFHKAVLELVGLVAGRADELSIRGLGRAWNTTEM